jgi:DnaJ-class molecular chaperone
MSIEEEMKQALELALEALHRCGYHKLQPDSIQNIVNHYIPLIEQAIAEAEKQEPVAYDVRCDTCGGDGYDPKDNNYFCSSCEGSGFLEKLFYTHPQPNGIKEEA